MEEHDQERNEMLTLVHREHQPLRLRHREYYESPLRSNRIALTHRQGSLHTRMLQQKGIVNVTIEPPATCPLHCGAHCTECEENGVPKWRCDACGIVFE